MNQSLLTIVLLPQDSPPLFLDIDSYLSHDNSILYSVSSRCHHTPLNSHTPSSTSSLDPVISDFYSSDSIQPSPSSSSTINPSSSASSSNIPTGPPPRRSQRSKAPLVWLKEFVCAPTPPTAAHPITSPTSSPSISHSFNTMTRCKYPLFTSSNLANLSSNYMLHHLLVSYKFQNLLLVLKHNYTLSG